MIIYKDILTNDELFTDSNRIKLVDDCLYEVECNYITRKQGDIVLAGSNPSAEDDGGDTGVDDPTVESGLDLVLNQKLTATSFDKKAYMGYLKTYSNALQAKWKEQGLEQSQIDEYKQKFGAAAKIVAGKLKDEPEFYLGESMNPDGMVAVLEYRQKPDGSGEQPTMLFFKHGLESEKC